MSIFQLIYTSEAVQPLSGIELQSILSHARKNNHQRTISGMLLYAEGRFMQVLEGPMDAVLSLYQKIRQDPRHCELRVIYQGALRQRQFPDWKMGFRHARLSTDQRRIGFSDLLRQGSPASRAFRVSSGTAHRLLLDFSQDMEPSPRSSPASEGRV